LQKLHAVHARHFNVKDTKIGRPAGKPNQSRLTIMVTIDLKPLRFERQGHRCQDILIIINKCNTVCHFGLPLPQNPIWQNPIWQNLNWPIMFMASYVHRQRIITIDFDPARKSRPI
jgi:hypothetical protein